MTTHHTSGAADLPETPKGTAADGKTELFNFPGHPLMVRAVDFNHLHGQLAALAAGQAVAPEKGITVDFSQAHELLEMFGGEPGLVTLHHGNEKSHSGAGLYAWWTDMPEEGAQFLGAQPDDEAVPVRPAPPAMDGPWKDHSTAQLVNELRDIAVQFHGTQQLRERIARVIVPLTDKLKAAMDGGDAGRLERERICAAIKAEDDYCVDHGNYMLDSDDCIAIVRGEWVRPDFAIDAARAAQNGAITP